MEELNIEELRERIGTSVGTSEWITIDQDRIERFAELTEDRQFIHVDRERAAQSPFGTTIAHGFLTLSMLSRMGEHVVPRVTGTRMAINYGFGKVRFLAPVRSGSNIRGAFALEDVEERSPGQFLLRWTVLMEIKGEERPALAADWITMLYL